MDYSQFVIMFRSIFHEGFGRPSEGVRRILRILVKKFRGLGGELRLRSGVRRIVHADGKAVAVELENGEILETDRVISSAGAVETLRMCGRAVEESPQNVPGDITYAETIFSLDRQPAELGHDATIVFYNDGPTFHYEKPAEPMDLRSGIICSPNNFQYPAPVDEGRIRVTALADPAAWLDLPDEEYVQRKQEWLSRLLESAIRFMPDFRPAIVDADMFTPRTVRRFTSHLNGCVYGSAAKFPDGRTGIDGLYLCGNDQGLLGIIGALMSGISIANAYALR